jgi:hypothetical protein
MGKASKKKSGPPSAKKVRDLRPPAGKAGAVRGGSLQATKAPGRAKWEGPDFDAVKNT